jgi:hypothetical protein
MHNKIKGFIILAWVIVPVLALTGCKTNYLLHKNITKDNWKHLVECNNLTDCDTFRLSGRTIGIKLRENRIAVGDILKGRKVGTWYYYYAVGDSIECYRTETYRRNDTIIEFFTKHNTRFF